MRIIKLSQKDIDFPDRHSVDTYFEVKLPNRNPVGQFLLTKGRIKKDGIDAGEPIIFTYQGRVTHIAKASSGRLENSGDDRGTYPFYFLVDISTIAPAQGTLPDIQSELEAMEIQKNIVRTRGWPRIQDSRAVHRIWKALESAGTTVPVPFPKSDFDFKPGYSKKVTTAKATFTEAELDLDLRHNIIQQTLYQQLTSKYGKDNVGTEQPSGVGTKIDVVVKIKNEYWFYEIKTAPTPKACLREAIGQLLEYGYWPGAQEPSRFIVVGESPLDEDGQEYILRLRKRFSLPLEYEAIVI